MGGAGGKGHYHAVSIALEDKRITIYDSKELPSGSSITFSTRDWQNEQAWMKDLADHLGNNCRPNWNATEPWTFVQGGHCRADKADQQDDDNCAFHAALFLADRLGIQSAKDMHNNVRVLRGYFAKIMCEAFCVARAALPEKGDGIEGGAADDDLIIVGETTRMDDDPGASCSLPACHIPPRLPCN